MEIYIFRPSVESYSGKVTLANMFERYSLIDKTVVEDRVIYVFGEKLEKPKISSPD